MPRAKWTCPGCKRVLSVPDATDLVLCSECRVGPDSKTRKIEKSCSAWTTSDYSFVVIGSLVLLGIALVVGSTFWRAVPKFDPDKVLVEKWLKENLEDGRWDEVKWYPAVRPQNFRDINLLHIIESMEHAKEAYEKGLWGSEEELQLLQKYYYKFRNSGVRTFCAMKFRVATLNGQTKLLRSQMFEIVNGSVKPCNDFFEVPSSPLTRFARPPFIYDGLRFFEDRDFDPFPVVATATFDERAAAAMIWKAPVPATLPAPVPIPETPTTPVATVQTPPPPQLIRPQPQTPVVAADVTVAQTVPPKIREYLDRAMEAQSAEVKKLEKRCSDFEARLRAAKKAVERTALNERIGQTEDLIAELKMTDGKAFLPEKPEVGDIGSLQAIEVIEILNEETLVVRWLPNGKGRLPKLDIAICRIDTKENKVGDTTIVPEMFRVTATRADPSDLLKDLKGDGKGPLFLAEPMQKDEIEKWRAQHEKERKKK